VSETKELKKRCRGNLPAVATAGSVARAADSEATVGEQELAEDLVVKGAAVVVRVAAAEAAEAGEALQKKLRIGLYFVRPWIDCPRLQADRV
jgi:hypothetical protein